MTSSPYIPIGEKIVYIKLLLRGLDLLFENSPKNREYHNQKTMMFKDLRRCRNAKAEGFEFVNDVCDRFTTQRALDAVPEPIDEGSMIL